VVRAAARQAVPARKGHRAGQPVHPREISFTADRRAAITAVRNGTTTASRLPLAGPVVPFCPVIRAACGITLL
jgi:hypothetical protein